MIGSSSPQSDIYSLGATLLRLVSGVSIETLYDDKAQSYEKRFAIQYKPKLGKTLDANLQTILDTCLKFNAEERYTTLAELRTALEQYLDTPLKTKTKNKEKEDNKSQSNFNKMRNRSIVLAMLGIIGTTAITLYDDNQHTHTLSKNEVAVLIDEKGTISEDTLCKNNRDKQTAHRDHTIIEYLSPAKLAIPLTITKTTPTTTLNYPIYTTINYEITDPANIHAIMDMYDRTRKWGNGTPIQNWNGTPKQYPNPEKLTLYLEDFIKQEANNYLKTHYDIEPKPTSLIELDPFTAHIKHAFETKLPRGLEYRGFEWTKGLPIPLKK